MGMEISIDELNRFLRIEMSAVESYQAALAKLEPHSPTRDQLLTNLRSHQQRVLMLRDAIIARGGEPASSAGAWGVLGASEPKRGPRVDEPTAIGALVDGEDLELARYRAAAQQLAAPARWLLTTTLLPAQQQTHDRLCAYVTRAPQADRDLDGHDARGGPGARHRPHGHVLTRHGAARPHGRGRRRPVRT